jgi:hypothetical protein
MAEAERDFLLEPHSINLHRSRHFENPQHVQSSMVVWLNLKADDFDNLFYYPIQLTSAADSSGRDLTPEAKLCRGSVQSVEVFRTSRNQFLQKRNDH